MTGIAFHVGHSASVTKSLRTIAVGHPHDKSCKLLQPGELGSLANAHVKEQAFSGRRIHTRVVRHLPASTNGKVQSKNEGSAPFLMSSRSKSKMLQPEVGGACHWLVVHRHLGKMLLVLGYSGL